MMFDIISILLIYKPVVLVMWLKITELVQAETNDPHHLEIRVGPERIIRYV